MANESFNSSPGGIRRSWIVPVAILLIVIVAVGAYVELRPRRIRVSVVTPVREDIANSISTNGKVEPIHGFEAHAPLAGTVQKVLVKEGDHVHAGQLLVQLDDSRPRADLADAETKLKGARERYANLIAGGSEQQLLSRRSELEKAQTEREAAQRQVDALTRLLQRGAATPAEVDVAKDRLARANSDLAQLKSQTRYSPLEQQHAQGDINDANVAIQLAKDLIDKCNVRAPFDGVVYFLPVHAGSFLNVGELLLQEADLAQLQVRAFVDEPEIGRLAIGEPVRITWEARPGHTWQGSVTRLPSTVVSRGSRMVGEILCKLDNSDHQLLPNVNVNVTIVSGSSEQALTVPREAVHEENGRNYLYVLHDNHLHLQDVKLGIANLTRVQILSGISDNDVVAVQSYSPSPMRDGVEVKVVENPS